MTKQIPINFNSLATRLLVVFIMCLPLWSSKSYSQEAESYVVLNTTDGTLTFKHDTEKPSDAYSLNYGYNFPGWNNQAEKIKTVIFDDSFADARPEFCSYWFAYCENLIDDQCITKTLFLLKPKQENRTISALLEA